jgi:hypothetical protein
MGRVLQPTEVLDVARAQYNLTAAADSWPEAARLTVYLNQALSDLSAELSKSNGTQWQQKVATSYPVAGDSSVLLPTDFVRLAGEPTWCPQTGTEVWTPITLSGRGFDSRRNTEVGQRGDPLEYQLLGTRIYLNPIPSQAIAVRIRYVYAMSAANLVDPIFLDGPLGWENFVATHICRSVARAERDNDGVRVWEQALAEERAKLVVQLSPNAEEAIEQVADVRDEGVCLPDGDVERYTYLRSGPYGRR